LVAKYSSTGSGDLGIDGESCDLKPPHIQPKELQELPKLPEIDHLGLRAEHDILPTEESEREILLRMAVHANESQSAT
jgi:hypothetical protein